MTFPVTRSFAGIHRELRDMAGSSTDPERIYPILHPQLRRDSPLLRSLEAMPN